MISRTLSKLLHKGKKSLLLLGPRQTGKSTLIKELEPELSLNLANEQTHLDFARNPGELESRLLATRPSTVFIDEVQRLPSLLNTIQDILDNSSKPPKFYLTGSSARKLKRGKANLIPGRLHTYFLGPLTAKELNYRCPLQQALETGLLPGIFTEETKEERVKTLRSYGAVYLKEEIQAEALTQNLEGFSRFLFLCAQCSGDFLDISKLASEAGISRQSAIRYFEVLEDTLVVHRCAAFSKSHRKRLIQHPKFYFFDTGVLNSLVGNFEASDDRKGRLFEHLFFQQLTSSAYAQDKDIRISTYRTEHGAEVDFIIEFDGTVWALELKSSSHVGKHDIRGHFSFSEFFHKKHEALVAYTGTVEKKIEHISIMPWQLVLQKMGL